MLKGEVINYKELEGCKIEYPVVLKSHSAEVIHKSELKGVVINIKNRKELLSSAESMRKNFAEAGYTLNEFYIQPYVETRFELLIGGFRDTNFGPMIMFGTGGKYVEYYKDTKMYSAYLSERDIEYLICSTTIGKLLSGVRGEAAADITELKSIIRSTALMMIENENITEFDINPLILTPSNKYIAVDVRIKTGT